jgi:AcrR family transcriptional regulator
MGKEKLPLKPRKTPAQDRSKATVEAIMQASTYILTEVGWSGLTTNAIADRAGVNIGSLYQFFPNKEAIIAELERRHVDATRKDLRKAFEALPAEPTLKSALTLIINLLIEEHRVAPALHKAISEELPRALKGISEDTERLREEFLTALKPFMRNVPNPELAAQLMGIAAHAIIHSVTAENPKLLNDPNFTSEVIILFEGFLNRP